MDDSEIKAGDDTIAGDGDDTISAAKAGSDTLGSAEHIASLGLDPAKISADDPAVTGKPRDERADSIDITTGTLTQEAQDLRAEAAKAEDAPAE